ncbi:MAG: thiamine pyrophosphate-dependent enzyme [Thermodesulfobacteriota bacterium]
MELSYPKEEYFHSPHMACPGCSIPLAWRYFLKAMGDEIVLVTPVGCSSVIASLPDRRLHRQGKPIKLLSIPLGSTATFAGGVKAAFTVRGDTLTQVVAFAGDGATFDIGFQGLSASAERNEDIIYVCIDNEAYMNTGNQRSSATPGYVVTATSPHQAPKTENKKDIALILAAHNIPYLCTATIAYPDDFMRKVKKAKDIKGFRFIHVLCPCTTGWRFATALTVEISRLAVETGVFPLFEVENGVNFTINEGPKGVPLGEYLGIQGRYRALTPEQIEQYQKEVEGRCNRLQWMAGYRSTQRSKRGGAKGR